MFHRALQALESDSLRATLIVTAVAAALALTWIAWLFRGDLPTYAVSAQARIEVVPAPFPVQAPVRGRLTAIHVAMSDEVEAGALLFELDSDPEHLELRSAERRIAALDVEIAALRRQAGAVADATVRQHQAARISGLQAQARLREVKAAEDFLETSARSAASLAERGAIADLEQKRATSELEQLAASRRSSQLEITRREVETRIGQADRQANLAEIEHEIASLEGISAGLEVQIERLEHDIERRRIRAPGAGRVGDLAKLQLGAWVEASDRLAWIIPPGDFQVVAEFKPETALGRIRPGMPTRVHLEGFPWTQFGTVDGRVLRMGSELRDGRVRVDLSIDRANPLIPIQHGLPGVAEVMVDTSSPADHILRSLGHATQHW